MEINDKLILFKKQSETDFKDITDRIKFFEEDYKSYCIIFKDEIKIHAKLENLIVMQLKEHKDICNFKIKYHGNLKTDIEKIDVYVNDSIKKYKVFCKNGYNFVCNPKDIEFFEFSESNKNLIDYWKSCACESSIDTVRNMLYLQYEQLNVEPDSVLYSYISKENSENSTDYDIICPFSFNISQLKAIKSALNNKISIIKGPPGTGKTSTILNIICNLIIQGKSIAVISSNNTAIENIEKKLADSGYRLYLASLGNGERKAKFFKSNYKGFELSKSDDNIIIPSKKLSVLSKLFESNNKLKTLNEEIEKIKLEQQYYQKFNYENLINVDKYKFYDSKDLIEYITKYQDDTKERKFTFFLWLKLILKYGFKKSLIKAKNRNQIITSLEYKYYSLKLNELTQELEELDKLLKENKFEELNLEFKYLSKNYLDFYLNKNINLELKFSQKDYKKNFSEFIKRYPIITSTAISFMTSIETEYMFDYVIIDESSQVTIPSAIPLLNKCKNIVVVGDDKQLSPIENYNTECNFDEVFDSNKQSLIASFMKIYPDTVTILLEHYRCDPSIIGFCNLKYYDNQLIPFTSADKDNQALNIYFTTSGNHMRRINNGEKNGIYNQREIDVIKEILNNKNFANISHEEIGIISPYRLQADKLQEKYKDIECDTIHRFQGREKNVVLFTPVLDNKASKKDLAFVDNARMINVTVSRAAKKFYLIVNEDLFQDKGKEIHDLINYISYKTMNKNLFKSKCVSIFDYLYKSKEAERKIILENCLSKSVYESEKLMCTLLDEILKLEPYKQLDVQEQVKIKDLILNKEIFNEKEFAYIQNNCSVDFLIKDKVNQDIVCVIEVDGVKYHENNKKRKIKDMLKDSILNKCKIPLLRLKTNGSNEDAKIKQIFNDYLNKFIT